MPIRAVLFDFGGVLMRTLDYAGRRKWEERLHLPPGKLEEIIFTSEAANRGQVGELPEPAMWQYVRDTFHLGEAELRELQHDFWSGDHLDRRLLDFLRDLRPRYRTAILSNAWDNARDLFTRRLGLGNCVDLLVISAEEGVAKPDARFYQLALERLGVRPEEAVFVDDLPANVEGARALGMHAIRFESAAQVMADVTRLLEN